MNKLLILLAPLSLSTIGYCQSLAEDFQKALNETGVVVRPPPPSFGDLIINPYYLEDLNKLSSDRKALLADKLTRITPQIAKERNTSPISGQVDPLLAILILQDLGTDQQKIEAFQDLDLYGKSLDDACRALATCEGSEGVKLLKQYAESQIPGIESEILESKNSPDPEKYAGKNPPSIKYFLALKALQGAYHNDGPAAAASLLERLISLYGDALTDKDRDGIRKELDEARLSREKFIQEKQEKLRMGDNMREEGGSSPDKNTNQPAHSISSNKWFWPVISTGMILLLFIGWLIARRTAAKP